MYRIPLSFKLNDETNVNVFGEKFTERQTERFLADLARSERVTLEQWRDRPIKEKFHERLSALGNIYY